MDRPKGAVHGFFVFIGRGGRKIATAIFFESRKP
jgi:hypothetical protein